MSDVSLAIRYTNVGRLMFNAARRFEEQIHAVVRRSGFPDVRLVHLTLTRNMDLEGTRLTVLADRAGITKQAMGELVDQCQTMGIVERRPDPTDRRARRIVFTARGRNLVQVLTKAIGEAEADMSATIGRRSVTSMVAALHTYLGEKEREKAV